jgi:Lrp/AsnC family transcriptional regulator, leucine-responsive regulatory protein
MHLIKVRGTNLIALYRGSARIYSGNFNRYQNILFYATISPNFINNNLYFLMLDKISKRILAELQNDGRISNVELATRVNLSPAACLERVRKLQDAGYILGYTAQLNPQLLDVSLLVFIEVVLDRTTPDVFEAFKRGVQAIPEVLECHMVAGGFDYLVKARVKDMVAIF